MLVAGTALIVKLRSTTRRGRKMGVTPTTLAAFSCQVALPGFGKVKLEITRFSVMNLCADRNLNYGIHTMFPESILPLTVPAAFRFMFRVVAKMQQRIVTLVRFNPDVSAVTTIPAGRATARDKFFAPESCDAISTVASFYLDLNSVNKHLTQY